MEENTIAPPWWHHASPNPGCKFPEEQCSCQRPRIHEHITHRSRKLREATRESKKATSLLAGIGILAVLGVIVFLVGTAVQNLEDGHNAVFVIDAIIVIGICIWLNKTVDRAGKEAK